MRSIHLRLHKASGTNPLHVRFQKEVNKEDPLLIARLKEEGETLGDELCAVMPGTTLDACVDVLLAKQGNPPVWDLLDTIAKLQGQLEEALR